GPLRVVEEHLRRERVGAHDQAVGVLRLHATNQVAWTGAAALVDGEGRDRQALRARRGNPLVVGIEAALEAWQRAADAFDQNLLGRAEDDLQQLRILDPYRRVGRARREPAVEAVPAVACIGRASGSQAETAGQAEGETGDALAQRAVPLRVGASLQS